MPQIPFTLAQIPDVNARSLGGQIEAPQVGNRALAQGLGQLSEGLGAAQNTAQGFIDEQRKQNIASLTATSSFTPQYLAMRQDSGPGADGFTDAVSQAYDQHVADSTDSIEDPIVRQHVKSALLDQKNQYVNEAANYQVAANEKNQRDVSGVALGTVMTNYQANPSASAMPQTIKDGNAIIDSLSGVDGTTKAAMKVQHIRNVTGAFMSGQIMNAQTSDDIQRGYALLNTPGMKNQLSPEQYAGYQRRLFIAGRSIARGEGAGISSAVSSINQRVTAGVNVDPAEIQQVENSPALMRNPSAQFQLAEAKAKIATNNETKGMSISDLRAYVNNNMQQASQPGAPSYTANVPPEVGSAIRTAAAATNCSPDYLAALTHDEYGVYLNSGNFGLGPSGGGSARGVAQMQPATWLGIAKQNADTIGSVLRPPVSGADLLKRSDSELLALRSDPSASLTGAGLYAQTNRNAMTQVLGRPATDAETYVGHLLGTAGGAKFLGALQNDPDAPAASVVGQDVANANKGFFKDAAGNPLSCQDAFAKIGASFANSPARASFVKAQQAQRILTQNIRQYSADPAGYAMNSGAPGMAPLSDDPTSWASRGSAVQAFAAKQGRLGIGGKMLPPMKPFTNQEAATFSMQLSSPDVATDQKLQILANVQRFHDPAMINAAYRQIGEKDPVAGLAGRVISTTGDAGVAHNILDGRALLYKNPSLAAQMGATPTQMGTDFFSYAGSALGMMPTTVMGRGIASVAQDAALAHYAHRKYSMGTGGAIETWSTDDYQKSLNAVLGGTDTHNAIQSVNGAQTLMPHGMDGSDIEGFMSKATPNDYVRLSIDGNGPEYMPVAGHPARPIPPEQMRNATIRAVGGGYYVAIMPDGKQAVSGARNAQGNLVPYRFKLDTETLQHNASGRAQPEAYRSPTGTFGGGPTEQDASAPATATRDGDPTPDDPGIQNAQPAVNSDLENAQIAGEE